MRPKGISLEAIIDEITDMIADELEMTPDVIAEIIAKYDTMMSLRVGLSIVVNPN